MPNAAILGVAYCLNHVPELALRYGNTPYTERIAKGESDFLRALPDHVQDYGAAAGYAPNLAYIGAKTLEELEVHPKPWYGNLAVEPTRFGRFGEIMPEGEFLGLLDACDVFDLIWLEKSFAASARERLAAHPLMTEAILARIETGHEAEEVARETAEAGALPLYHEGRVVGCARRGHESDGDLSAYVLLENLACKTGGVLALLHLMKNADLSPGEVDFVVECSEEAAGDMNQRGGGNFAKAVAEIAGCGNASGCDVRGFCAGPVNAVLAAASMAAAGTRRNVVVLAGGAVPKLYMNARDHVRKGLPALENCLGNFAVLIGPDDGAHPVIRLDAVGKHTVAAGASPQAITTSLVFDPLTKLGLGFEDVDKYAAELHIPEITLPAGAGDVPLANFKMIAALAVMKGQLEKAKMGDFVARKGIPGFAHTQGHIPSGVPYLGHVYDAIREGRMKRVMVIGKGSLFLARLTNLSDGASFLVEAPIPATSAPTAAVTKEEIKSLLLEALADLALGLKGTKAP